MSWNSVYDYSVSIRLRLKFNSDTYNIFYELFDLLGKLSISFLYSYETCGSFQFYMSEKQFELLLKELEIMNNSNKYNL